MPWNITDEETTKLMRTISAVLKPWYTDKQTTIKWENEDGSVEDKPITLSNCIRDDAPQEIKDLDEVYMSIIEQGAVIGRPLGGDAQ